MGRQGRKRNTVKIRRVIQPRDGEHVSSGARQPVVVLVHGTFARNAAWTKPGSLLYDRMEQLGCKMIRFPWSGRNAHYARRAAARQLARDLRELQSQNPGSHLWIVAHSHGGNIALHAGKELWKGSEERHKLTVVTLATPFIHSRTRDTPGLGQALLFVVALVSAYALLSAWIPGAIGRFVASPSWQHWISACIAALIVLEIGATILLSIAAAWRYRKEFGFGFRARLISSIHAPAVVPGQALAIRAAGDEATGTLIVGQFMAGLSAMVTRRVFSLGKNRTFGLSLMGMVVLIFQVLIVIGASFSSRLAVETGFWIGIIFVVILGIMGGLLLLMCGASFVFGSDGPFISIFASCSTEAAPPGKPEIYQLPPFAGMEKGGLNHSKLYDYEPAIDRIADLIKNCSITSIMPTIPG